MDKNDIYHKLRDLFAADLMFLIIPGVIHNLSNPMGGIMGRVQLMQMRIARNFERIESLHPEIYKKFALDKINSDVNILAVESEKMLSIFRNFEGKISALTDGRMEMINLSEMIEAEVEFADFYLDFKHTVNKNKRFEDNIPPVYGDKSVYSFCISALLNSARQRMLNTVDKEFEVSVDFDDNFVNVLFQDSGEKITTSCQQIADGGGVFPDLQELSAPEHGLCYAFMLLRQCGLPVELFYRNDRNMILIHFPYEKIPL